MLSFISPSRTHTLITTLPTCEADPVKGLTTELGHCAHSNVFLLPEGTSRGVTNPCTGGLGQTHPQEDD